MDNMNNVAWTTDTGFEAKEKSSSNKKQFVYFSGRKTRNNTINMRSQM
jgi:hypothetical protein